MSRYMSNFKLTYILNIGTLISILSIERFLGSGASECLKNNSI